MNMIINHRLDKKIIFSNYIYLVKSILQFHFLGEQKILSCIYILFVK